MRVVGGVTWAMVAGEGELYARHAVELTRFATALVGPDDAADVVADAMVSVLRSGRLSAVDNQRAYLFRAVFNEAANTVRSRRRRSRREHVAATPEFADGPEVDGVDVVRRLSMLSARQRAVVFLTYWADLTAPGCAQMLGCSTRTVERELAGARRLLERTWDERID